MEQATKKKILTGLTVAAGLLFLAALIWFVMFKGQFVTYRDAVYHFSIKYPRKWQLVVHPQPGAAVAFVAPQQTALDIFRENVNISIEAVPPDIATLKSFSDKVILQMTAVFKNMKVTAAGPITFGDRQGYQVAFYAEKPDNIKILTAWTIKSGETAYILTYMAVAKKYELYLPLVGEMMKSFRLN